MGDTNVQTSGVGGGVSGHHHHQLHHHQLHHHHQATGSVGHPGGSVSSHHDTTALSFGLGFFPDPSDISSKSLPPFSSFGETEGLGEGLSGRLLDLGGGNGGPPPWDLYGEGLSARLIDVGAPTPLGLGIGVGVGLGLGFAPPPPSAVPARDGQHTPNGNSNGSATGPGGTQYRPWESKNGGGNPDGSGNPPTLLELGRMMAVTPPPGNTTPNHLNHHQQQQPSGFVTELQLFTPHVASPKLPSFQSQFQHSFSSPSPGPTATVQVTQPPQLVAIDPNLNGFHNNNNGSVNGVRYPVVPAPVHPSPQPHPVVSGHAVPTSHPGTFGHHAFTPSNGINGNGGAHHYPLAAGQHLQNGSSPVVKMDMDDSRSPFSTGGGPIRPDARKKEKRKYRASSMESSGSDADGQVPNVSSSGRAFKQPLHHHLGTPGGPGSVESGGNDSINGDKGGKKKRKRCGECVGCMRKDNCASCAPCRNDKSHQICKMRRCEKLTEKKIKIPREKGEGKAARQNANSSLNNSTTNASNVSSITVSTPQPSATPPASAMAANGVPSWDRGYTPNANWAGPSPVAAVEENQWNGYSTTTAADSYASDPTFNFQQGGGSGGFHPPAPVATTVEPAFANGSANSYRPRPSPQPQQIQIGGFSPHMSSPHPSPGSGQQQQQINGRCGSVPPHFDSTNGYISNGPSPRPPSSNPPETYRNGDSMNNTNGTGHPNGQPGYPSPVPQLQGSQSSNGYPGQQPPIKGEPSQPWDQNESKRATPHEELNNRLKEKILNKQQQQQQPQHYGQQNGNNGQYYVNYNGQTYNGDEQYVNGADQNGSGGVGGGHFNPPSASSPSSNNVRLDVHVEQQQQQNSTAHFLGPAHPQSSGTGGGNQPAQIADQPQMVPQRSPAPPTPTTAPNSASPQRNHCPHVDSTSAAGLNEQDRVNKLKNNIKDEVPPCECFPTDQCKSPVR